MDKNLKTLHCIFRLSGAGTDNVYYIMSSNDGSNWSNKKEILRVVGREIVSPSIVFAGNKYYMYFIDITDNYKLKRLESQDLLEWEKEVTCSFNGGYQLWHIDTVEYGGGVILSAVTTDYSRVVLFKSRDYFQFNLSKNDFITADAMGQHLYKCDLQLVRTENETKIGVFYGLIGDANVGVIDFRIGYCEASFRDSTITNSFIPELISISGGVKNSTIPTLTNSTGEFIKIGKTLIFTFRMDVGDLSGITTTDLVGIKIPSYRSKPNCYQTSKLDVGGTGNKILGLYSYSQGLSTFAYLRKDISLATEDRICYVSDLVNGNSIRGTITLITE